MYTNVWSKYLPIIRIVMKRSLTAEQMLVLNIPDFERAGMKRKSGYKFSFGLKEGKLKNVIIDLPLASSLASVLLEDKAVRELIDTNEFHISLSPKYELTIRHIPHPQMVMAES
jgi:hypothetical protein